MVLMGHYSKIDDRSIRFSFYQKKLVGNIREKTFLLIKFEPSDQYFQIQYGAISLGILFDIYIL